MGERAQIAFGPERSGGRNARRGLAPREEKVRDSAFRKGSEDRSVAAEEGDDRLALHGGGDAG
jgi:hypothetical protein